MRSTLSPIPPRTDLTDWRYRPSRAAKATVGFRDGGACSSRSHPRGDCQNGRRNSQGNMPPAPSNLLLRALANLPSSLRSPKVRTESPLRRDWRRGSGLDPVFPVGRTEYARDFTTQISLAAFQNLLDRASAVFELDSAPEYRPRAVPGGRICHARKHRCPRCDLEWQ